MISESGKAASPKKLCALVALSIAAEVGFSDTCRSRLSTGAAMHLPSVTASLFALQIQHEERAATRLAIELEVDAKQRDQGTLSIRFGPHRLTAPLRMSPH